MTTADIYDEILPELKGLGLQSDCTGGGRIEHNSDVGTILVYGYSMVSILLTFTGKIFVYFNKEQQSL